MLWYKGWLETRWKFLFLMLFYGAMFAIGASMTPPPAPAGTNATILALSGPGSITFVLVTIACVFFGGAGIVTQPSFVVTRGLHGSTQFTLSLPVSRLRLLAIRVTLGWCEVVGFVVLVCGLWMFYPPARAVIGPLAMCEFAATLILCGSAIYAVSVLLATFLEEAWRIWGSLIFTGALWLLFTRTPVPASLNIFRAMSLGSPLMAHAIPWPAMAFSLGLGMILLLVAAKVAQTREY